MSWQFETFKHKSDRYPARCATRCIQPLQQNATDLHPSPPNILGTDQYTERKHILLEAQQDKKQVGLMRVLHWSCSLNASHNKYWRWALTASHNKYWRWAPVGKRPPNTTFLLGILYRHQQWSKASLVTPIKTTGIEICMECSQGNAYMWITGCDRALHPLVLQV